MNRDRQEFLRLLEDRLSRLSTFLDAKRRIGEQAPEQLHARSEAIRRDIARARQATDQAVHDAVAKARASRDDMDRDYDSPPLRPALRCEELQALSRHVQLTARLVPHLGGIETKTSSVKSATSARRDRQTATRRRTSSRSHVRNNRRGATMRTRWAR